MLASVKLEAKVNAALQKRVPPNSDGEAVGFDILGLLGPLITELIIWLTSGCGKNNDPETVAVNLVSDNPITRAVIRRGVNRSEIPNDYRKVSREVVLDVMKDSTKEEALQLVEEVNSTVPDWSMF